MQLRFLWYILLVGFFLLSFFGVFSPPKSWTDAMTAIAPISSGVRMRRIRCLRLSLPGYCLEPP